MAEAVLRVLRELEAGSDPCDRGQAARLDVGDNAIDRVDVTPPSLRMIPVPPDRRIRGPDVASLILLSGVVRPVDPGLAEQISFGQEVEARGNRSDVSLGVDHL